MKVVTAAGETFDLGETEATPTVSLVDYSRRVTDDFGVTTVVPRDFARRMSVRLALPVDQVDTLQRRLIDLRAAKARWVADDRYGALAFDGFYKDFSIDLPAGAVSYCTLTVEGLAEATALADLAGDPAPDGTTSTLQLIVPTEITAAQLVASNVAESDYPAWAAGAYGKDVRVVRDHRVWESLVAANADDPLAMTGRWLEVGPTNRWAMFDQALGTVTTRNGPIVVTIDPGVTNAVAALDVTGTLVRVQAAAYDRAIVVDKGMAIFTDLPTAGGQVTVSITGNEQVAVGTLLVGRVTTLGTTESAPTAAITDFSRKDVDDFGEATIVERAWSKRMTAGALIRTDALDMVMNRVAAVRARPSLWIADEGTSALTIYGFFKDFSVAVGPAVSKASLSIEGLSRAAPLAIPLVDRIERGPYGSGDPLKPGNIVGLPDGSEWRWVGTGTHPVGPPVANSFEWDLVAAAPAVIPPTTVIGGAYDPATGGTIGGVPASSLGDALTDVAGAKTGLAQVMRQALSSQLLAEARKERMLALTHVDGVPARAVIKRVDQERQDGDEALAESVSIVRVAIDDERSAREADVVRLDQARVDQYAAQAQALTDVHAELIDAVGDERADRQAEVVRLDQARVDQVAVQAAALGSVKAALETEIGDERTDRQAEVTRLDQARVDQAAAGAQELSTVRAAIDGDLDAERATREAEVIRLDQARIDQNTVQSQALADVRAALEGEVDGERVARQAEVSRLDQARADQGATQAQALEAVRAVLAGDIGDERADREAEVTRLDQARVDQGASQAQAIAEVRASIDDVDAAVRQQAAAIVDINGKILAYVVIETIAGSSRARARIVADGVEGSQISFTANSIELENDVDGQVLNALRAVGGNIEVGNDLILANGRIISRSADFMSVTGKPFGTTNQFLEWYGPIMPIEQCAEGNGISWKRLDGKTYTRGALIAGTISNAVQTTSIATDASVTTGQVGSNGGQRIVVVSYSLFVSQAHFDTSPPASGVARGVVVIRRNGQDVDTLIAEGEWTRDPSFGQGEPGGYYVYIAQAKTFYDNSGGQSVTYSAHLIQRDQGPGVGSGAGPGTYTQSISIVQSEG